MKSTTPQQQRQRVKPPILDPSGRPRPGRLRKEPDPPTPGRRTILYLRRDIYITAIWVGARNELQAAINRLRSNRRFRGAQFYSPKRTPDRSERDSARRCIRRILSGADGDVDALLAAKIAAGLDR